MENKHTTGQRTNFIDDQLESPLEERFYDLLANYEISSMVKDVILQKKIGKHRVDFLIQITGEKEFIVEVEGWKYHRDREEYDKERQGRLEDTGRNVLRFDWGDVIGRPEWVANVLEGRIELIKSI